MKNGTVERDYHGGVHLTDEDVQRFVELYERRTGIRLSSVEARERAGKLLQLVRVLLQELPFISNKGEPMSESERHQ
jgi:hypothetical protein